MKNSTLVSVLKGHDFGRAAKNRKTNTVLTAEGVLFSLAFAQAEPRPKSRLPIENNNLSKPGASVLPPAPSRLSSMSKEISPEFHPSGFLLISILNQWKSCGKSPSAIR
jgi:hypothetical protein